MGPGSGQPAADCRRAVSAGGPRPLHDRWLLVLVKLVTPPLLPVALPWPDEPAPLPEPVAAATLVPAEVDVVPPEVEGGAEALSLPAPPAPAVPNAISGEMVLGTVW